MAAAYRQGRLKPFDKSPGYELRELLVLREMEIGATTEYAKLSLPAAVAIASKGHREGVQVLADTLGRLEAGLNGAIYRAPELERMADLGQMYEIMDKAGYFKDRAEILGERRRELEQRAA